MKDLFQEKANISSNYTQNIETTKAIAVTLTTDRFLRHSELKKAKRRTDKLYYLIITYISSFIGIAGIAFVNEKFFSSTDMVLLIGSFGATAVIVYGLPESPLARPLNVLSGHVMSSVIGVTSFIFFKDIPWVAAAVAVSTSILAMQITNTVHPPGGATALIAVIGSNKIHALGYLFAIAPVGIGASFLVVVAVVVKQVSYRKKKRLKKLIRKFY
jgi:CBS-domain-containing membrane protein